MLRCRDMKNGDSTVLTQRIFRHISTMEGMGMFQPAHHKQLVHKFRTSASTEDKTHRETKDCTDAGKPRSRRIDFQRSSKR
ncbi:hypothetical protein ANN_10643 [Periplaneta americana]|uniref:Uncharacterized protein n=1 Tax=Periplaneta americana TaxID=6978 RepID=A0ABQ8T4J7_PERAM|nr:hypothetical protein ANN_10643 [Periplaneta americana]